MMSCTAGLIAQISFNPIKMQFLINKIALFSNPFGYVFKLSLNIPAHENHNALHIRAFTFQPVQNSGI